MAYYYTCYGGMCFFVTQFTLVFFLLSRNHFYVPFVLFCTYVVTVEIRLTTTIPTSFGICELHSYYTRPLHRMGHRQLPTPTNSADTVKLAQRV